MFYGQILEWYVIFLVIFYWLEFNYMLYLILQGVGQYSLVVCLEEEMSFGGQLVVCVVFILFILVIIGIVVWVNIIIEKFDLGLYELVV